jgi:universal stress protein A
MNIKRILCPIDFSEFNEVTNQYASVLASASGAEIVYLHVSIPDIPYGTTVYVDLEQDEVRCRQQLETIKPTIEGIPASHVVEFGTPANQIVTYAKENDIDLIVMGTHGRTGFRRALMGSVAEVVVRKAECPVLALKSGTKVPLNT